MWRSLNGRRPGENALRARCTRTPESLPTEYIRIGRSNCETASRKISIDSASSCLSWLNVKFDSSDMFVLLRQLLGAGVQPAFPLLRRFPPPPPGPHVLRAVDGARAACAADGGIAAVVQDV